MACVGRVARQRKDHAQDAAGRRTNFSRPEDHGWLGANRCTGYYGIPVVSTALVPPRFVTRALPTASDHLVLLTVYMYPCCCL
jgi:hypothetical protein